MITHKDVVHFYELLAEEMRLTAQFSKSLTEHLITGEQRIFGDLHSASLESIRDVVSLHDLPHYPLNFIDLPPKYLKVYLTALMFFVDICATVSNYGFASVERVAQARQAQA